LNFENCNATVTFRFVHLDTIEDGTDRDELTARYLPHSLYYSLVCSLLGSAKGCKTPFKNLFSNRAVIEGERMFMLKLQHDEKEGKSIQLVIRLDRDGDGLAAGRDCINAVYQRVRPILDQLCERGHFGMFYWGEVQCKCGGNIPLDTQRCTRCKEMCMKVCSQWKNNPISIPVPMETKPKLKTSSENPQDSSEDEGERKETKSALTCINSPGSWDIMISYTQRDGESVALAEAFYHTFRERGMSVWLDIKMQECNEAAMEEGVKNSHCVLAILSGPDDTDSNSYFNRTFCVQELKWAQSAGVPIQPVCAAENKKKIGELLSQAEKKGIQGLGKVDIIHLDRSRISYWNAGFEDVLRGVQKHM